MRDPNFGAVVLTFYFENIWNLMIFATGRHSKKFAKFFDRPFWERGFRQLTFLKDEDWILSNIVRLSICGIQILYRFENTKEPMPEDQYLGQYAVGLTTKISWFIKTGKDMTSPIGTSLQFDNFDFLQRILQRIVRQKDLNDFILKKVF